MHKKFLNHARIAFSLTPRGPVLVKSGVETPDPTRPSMEFVRTTRSNRESIYLPGTSLKGAMRSHAERCLKGLGETICDPFGDQRAQPDRQSCHTRHRQTRRPGEPDSPYVVHQRMCAACRTFGSLSIAGRCNVTDAYPDAEDDPWTTEKRTQVGINRSNNEAQKGSLFDLEVAVQGTFRGEILLHNFELWQLALVGSLLRDIDDGMVPIGFGKSRGLGQMAAEITSIDLTMSRFVAGHVLGASGLDSDEGSRYGLRTAAADDQIDLGDVVNIERTWRGSRMKLDESGSIRALFDQLIDERLAALDRRGT